MGVASLILGIVSIVFSWSFGLIPGIVGIILGAIGKNRSNGTGPAKAGLICSIIGVVLSSVLGIIIYVAYGSLALLSAL